MEGTRASRGGSRLCRESPSTPLDRRARVLLFNANGNHGSPSVLCLKVAATNAGALRDGRSSTTATEFGRNVALCLGRVVCIRRCGECNCGWLRRRRQADVRGSRCSRAELKLSTRVTPGESKLDLSGIEMPRPSASSGGMAGANGAALGRVRASPLKAASDRIERHPQEACEIPSRTVRVSKLDSLLVPPQNFPYLRVSQLSKGSARSFHARLLIDQAHCLRDPKGTAPASGHGSIDGPKGRERVRALVRDR